MKKIISYIVTILVAVAATSCSKEDIPMTSTVDLAGEWMVTAYYEDGADLVPYWGPFMVITYNTNQDDGKELWVNDLGNFWEFSVKVPCSTSGLTFGSDQMLPNNSYDSNVKIYGGKVVFNGATTPIGGQPADAIEFKVEFDDDDDNLVYVCKGYRRTGLAGGEE